MSHLFRFIVGALTVWLTLSAAARADSQTLEIQDGSALAPQLSQILVVVDDDETRRVLGSEQKLAEALVLLPAAMQSVGALPRAIGYDTGPTDPGSLAAAFPAWRRSGIPIVAGLPGKPTPEQTKTLEAARPPNVTFGYAFTMNRVLSVPGATDAHGEALPPKLVFDSTMTLSDAEPILALQMLQAGRGRSFPLNGHRFLKLTRPSERGIRKIPIQDLTSGATPLEVFKDKYVLIGTDQRMVDAFTNLEREQVNGVFFHALALARLLALSEPAH